ncbi:expansin-like protein [Heterostelium album PN500]|uniref:Expansin-like protein n=1 Tax=Heterostelium pallidum (strain ATCC 26659 / Pp 5 / PN500) TaxID=670386 RepID=D3AW65_HETP5|nr:expansin-like protein [Heterostelium album PN500]EFA86538.1 expansin-like protein [Heterostelium album PN500]|eukprot:XP_020438643.1 expansin-like protein [Heterostelium album PN500]
MINMLYRNSKMRIFYSLLLFTTLLVIVKSQNGLSPCGEGSAIWNSDYSGWTDGRGLCGLPTPPSGVVVAGVNRNYFTMTSGSGLCGTCFKLTGPAGSVIAQAVDVCDATALCTQTDHAHFILSPADYNVISGNSTATLYNVGYQMITCPNEGDITVTPKPDGSGSYSYYFSLTLSGFSVPIKSVEVTVGGTSGAYQQLKYQSSLWVFNKNSIAFTFPGKVRVTSQTGQQIVYSMTNGAAKMIPNFDQAPLYADCGTPVAPQYIYQDSLAQGWTDASWDFVEKNYNDNSAASGSNIAIGLSAYGGLKIQSLTSFSTANLATLEFSAKANVSNSQILIFLHKGANFNVTVGTEWANYNVTLASLSAAATETAIAFQNFQGSSLLLMVDNIKWGYSSNVSTSTSTSGTGLVTMPPVTKPPSTTASGSATTTSVVTTASTTAQVTTTRGPSGTTAGGDGSSVSDSENTGGDKHVDSSSSTKLTISTITLLLISIILF